MNYLTKLEEILLISIWRLKDNAYGITIREEVKNVTGKAMSFGALYVTLDKLVKKEYIKKTPGLPTPERGGRSKNYYHLTDKGIVSLNTARKMNRILWENVPELIK
jgi:PadR family transcriptional regulator PadR